MNRPPARPPVLLERRPSDFVPRGTMLFQAGTTTTCCTCCLHWVGAAVGGTVGVIHGWRSHRRTHPIPAGPARWVTVVTVMTGIAVGALLISAALGISTNRWAPTFILPLLQTLFYVPSLAFVISGSLSIVAAFASSRRLRPEERQAACEFACRVTWMSFNYANLVCLGGVGAMWIFKAEIVSMPTSAISATVVLFGGMIVAFALYYRDRRKNRSQPHDP